jgi:hypothetical protein
LIAYLQGFQQVARTAVHIDNRAPVQHNRIAAPGPPGFEYLVRSAEVIEELKPSAEAGPAASRITFEIRFLRDQPTGRPLGYAAGDELIMFFEYWQSDTGVYRLYEDRPWVLAVDRGMVDRPFAGGGQMQLDELLETIRGIW